jgi:polyhydroxyalkanoate synthesis regulator phasin
MLDDMRKYMEAALGQMSPSRAREVARSVLKGQPSEQVNRFAHDLAGWSQRTREKVTELVRSEVKRQLKAMGVVTRDDLDAVRARVRDLEKAGGRSGAAGRRTSGAKRSSSKRSATRTSTRKTSAAKKSGAKTSAREQPAAKTSTAQTSTREGATT